MALITVAEHIGIGEKLLLPPLLLALLLVLVLSVDVGAAATTLAVPIPHSMYFTPIEIVPVLSTISMKLNYSLG